MTHRERLQNAISKLQEVYDEVGYLRDHANPEMKAEYNKVREHLPSVWKYLQNVDNRCMPKVLADEEL